MGLETSFGRWLRARRRVLDLTQQDLARRVGCSIVTIRKIEADERRPSRQIAERLLDGLQVAVEDRATLITLARGEPYRDPAPVQAAEPLLRAPEQPPSNLPAPLTQLIGRKQDIAAARNALLRGEVRLLTLIGPPGIGKTRLSIAVARDIHPAFSDGASFVALAPIDDPALVLVTIVQTLGVKESAGRPLLETLKAALQGQRRLLLLDNFEHLLAAAPQVVALLEACPGLKALVTSRAALHVRGERLYPVPPLLLPDLTRLPATGALARTPAVALFVERAQAVLPEFRLTAQNAPAVAAICVRLDGLPLAIELAAAWVRVLACAEIAQEIEHDLGFLTTSLRDVPARHRSLRAVFDHSWRLLAEQEQHVFRKLSVFRGGFQHDAAEAVADATLPLLAALVDKSLLRRNEAGRYELHELIRQYAEEQLRESGETGRVHDRHLEYFLALAEAAQPALWGAQRGAWLERLEREHDNLRSAFQWALDQGAAESAARLGRALWRFWEVYEYLSEGRLWLERVLSESGSVSTAVRAWALLGAGGLAVHQGDFAGAAVRLEESLALSRELGDQRGMALALGFLGWAATEQGDLAGATARLEEGLSLSRELGDSWSIGAALQRLGMTAWFQGDLAGATARFEEGLSLSREIGDMGLIAWCLSSQGGVALSQGDVARATQLIEDSLPLFQRQGDTQGMAWALHALGEAARDQGDHERAAVRYVASLKLFRERRDHVGIARSLEDLAMIAEAQGQPARAVRLCGAAAALCEVIGSPIPAPERPIYERTIAAVHARLGEATFAAAWADGRAMPLEQAIEYALNATSPAPNP